MSTYAIGDIQGCFKSFLLLLDRISFDPQNDTLWLVGDLVNRGPRSLETIRLIKRLDDSVRLVLGNHELFLLAAAEGISALRPKDTIHDILEAEDRSDLLAWIRRHPLHYREEPYLMVHAGLLPQWSIEDTIDYAREVEDVLAGSGYREFLRRLFDGPSPRWSPSLRGYERLVSIARALTRLRTCKANGEMSSFSGPPAEAPAGFVPWFSITDRRSSDATVISGHWAALGLYMTPNILAIDSGCVWGRQLTAVRLEDRQVFQVDYFDGCGRD